MKRYTDRETAPLKFHDFYGLMMLIFGIPCAGFMAFSGAVFWLADIPYEFYLLSPLVDTAFHAAYLVLFLKARKRLDQWQRSGLKLLYGILALTALRDTLIGLTDIFSLIELPFRLLFVGLIFIYYRKREGLFTEDGTAAPKAEPAPAYTFDPVEEPAPMGEPAPETESASAEEAVPEEPQPAPQMRFCRHCGARLAEGARFCTACGRPVEE